MDNPEALYENADEVIPTGLEGFYGSVDIISSDGRFFLSLEGQDSHIYYLVEISKTSFDALKADFDTEVR